MIHKLDCKSQVRSIVVKISISNTILLKMIKIYLNTRGYDEKPIITKQDVRIIFLAKVKNQTVKKTFHQKEIPFLIFAYYSQPNPKSPHYTQILWFQTLVEFKLIFLTVMNYNSPESAESHQNKNPAQQSRTRLTLLADISEANPSPMQAQQESPVLTYLRQLQDNKVQAEKQNVSNFNRKISQSQDRNQKKNPNKQSTQKEQNIRKQTSNNNGQYWQEPQNKSQSRQTKTQSQSNRRQFEREAATRPGIQRYRKIINLADPIENLQYENESMFQKSKFRSEYFNEDEDLLFKKELKKHNGRKFNP